MTGPKFPRLAALLLLGASALPAPAAPVETDEWMEDLFCDTLPFIAREGYVVRAYRRYLSLVEGRVELYKRNDLDLVLLEARPAAIDPNTGNADEMVRRYTAPGLHLESRLFLDLDRPGERERSWLTIARDGQPRAMTLTLSCY